jgi:hypothetical protein
LGENKKEALETAVSIKEVDVNRTLVILKKNVETSLDKEEGQSSLLTSKFSNLTGDLILEEAQESLEQDDLLMPLIKLKKPRKREILICLGSVEALDSKINILLKMGSIKGLFWNSDGFGDIAKHLFVKEQLREEKLDFIVLLETRRSHFSIPFLKNLANGLDFSWFCLPPHGRSGGILVGINNATLQVGIVQTGDLCQTTC